MPMTLGDYERSKFAIANVLRSGLAQARETRMNLDERFRALFARLAEDRFNLAVVGRFNRGKTSLMNAILGTARLPTGVVPLTSVITSVAYGSEEKVVLKFQQRILTKEIPIEALRQHITQQGNPGNVQGIVAAEVQLPAEILRRGFYFVDTPGIGSAIIENTLTTETFLPEADAILLVTSYESPLSEEEVRFFKVALSSRRRVFVVVNKHDIVSTVDRGEALDFVHQQVHALASVDTPQIFSVSSTEGLAAKQSHDDTRLAASGIPHLEQALIQFLVEEKTKHILIGLCSRARELLKQLPCSDSSMDLVAQIDALAKEIGDDSATSPLQHDSWSAPTAPYANLHHLRSCEICSTVTNKVWDFLAGYQYDLTVSNEMQRLFAERRGFCAFHAWQYETIASPYSVCNGYPTLLDHLATELRSAASATGRREYLVAKIESLLPRQDQCPLCVMHGKAEGEALGDVATRLNRDPDRALASLSAICLTHFVMLLAEVRDDDTASRLVDRQAALFERVSEDMRRYALKYNAVRRDLASQEDSSAAERALLAISGRRNLNLCARQSEHRSRGWRPIALVGTAGK